MNIGDMIEAAKAMPRPAVGAKVGRDKVPPDGRTVPGVVLAVAEDEHALGGWVVLVRWWLEHRKCWTFQAYEGLDFISPGSNIRGEVVPAKVRVRQPRSKPAP